MEQWWYPGWDAGTVQELLGESRHLEVPGTLEATR